MQKAHQGFSLVELSIVLVILGLLIGGVLTGQNLIRAAEMRAVTTEHKNIITAVNVFREKYLALPGDMNNAQNFWGIAHATPATCVTTASTTTATCNGNGDGQILASTGSNESFRFWQHLANAGLYEGVYTGIEGTTGNNESAIAGTNSPRSKISNGTWYIRYRSGTVGHTEMFDMPDVNHVRFGAQTTNLEPQSPIFRPEEAWNIDMKVDDGMPATGSVVTRVRVNCTNATAAAADSDNFNSVYSLSDTTLRCALIFKGL